MDLQSKEFWQNFATTFHSDPTRFENPILIQAYSEALIGVTPEEIKRVIIKFAQENDHKLPTANELRAAWKGYPSEARKRGLESIDKIFSNIIGAGATRACESYETDYNAIEKRFIQKQGGLVRISEMLNNDNMTALRAHGRDILAGLYEKELQSDKDRAVQQLNASKENHALKAAMDVIEGGSNE